MYPSKFIVTFPQQRMSETDSSQIAYSSEAEICQDLCFPWHVRQLVAQGCALRREFVDLEIKDHRASNPANRSSLNFRVCAIADLRREPWRTSSSCQAARLGWLSGATIISRRDGAPKNELIALCVHLRPCFTVFLWTKRANRSHVKSYLSYDPSDGPRTRLVDGYGILDPRSEPLVSYHAWKLANYGWLRVCFAGRADWIEGTWVVWFVEVWYSSWFWIDWNNIRVKLIFYAKLNQYFYVYIYYFYIWVAFSWKVESKRYYRKPYSLF